MLDLNEYLHTLSLYKHTLCLLFQVYLNQQDRRIDQKPEYVHCTSCNTV